MNLSATKKPSESRDRVGISAVATVLSSPAAKNTCDRLLTSDGATVYLACAVCVRRVRDRDDGYEGADCHWGKEKGALLFRIADVGLKKCIMRSERLFLDTWFAFSASVVDGMKRTTKLKQTTFDIIEDSANIERRTMGNLKINEINFVKFILPTWYLLVKILLKARNSIRFHCW